MSAQLGVDVRGVDSAEEAIRTAEIVVTATRAREPVLRGDWIAPGAHINAVGSNRSEARELDDGAIGRCDFICADSVEQSKIESGDLISPIERGLIRWDRVSELSDLAAGKIQGRKSEDEVTLFKSNGIALEDVAAATVVYKKAIREGIGRKIEL